jgi:Phage P22-like portal protein
MTEPKKRKPRTAGTLKAPELPSAKEKPAKKIDNDFLRTAIERAHAAHQRERDNMEAAYEDLEFLAGNQWPAYARQQREAEERPCLTINRLPQFVRQITGDIRLMRPAIKAVPIDARAKAPVAELISSMIRYIENRSDAQSAYTIGADSMVACGIGHWRVTTEYAEETTFNQEIRISQIDDGVSVLWDPDAMLPTREDAKWCIVPYDLSKAAYEEKYPDAPADGFAGFDRQYTAYWQHGDLIRIGEYWEKRSAKRELALMPDGAILDLTGVDEETRAALAAQGAEFQMRDGHKIFRSVITLGHVLEEPQEWAGRVIPIVPVLGEEIRVGRIVIRRGVVRNTKDAQRVYNYSTSAQTEILALAPKAPWIGTEKNFEENRDKWETSNTRNWPALEYTPDPLNGGAPPQRIAPPVSSPGLSEAIERADNDMQAVTGLYNASLGAQSNEISGVAIQARDQQGDVGNIAYIENFKRALGHTGRILVDLIPHIYDTERMVQVIGEDGNIQTVTINKSITSPEIADDAEEPIESYGAPPPLEEEGEALNDQAPVTPTSKPRGVVLNDVTIGAYGIVVETGPSYSTKREQARDGMMQFVQAFPAAAPLILDLVARAQDWPFAGEIARRAETILPPPIQAMLAREKAGFIGEIAPPNAGQGAAPIPPPGAIPLPPPAQPPNPVELAKAQAEVIAAKSKQRIAELAVQEKELEVAAKRFETASKAHSDIHGVNGPEGTSLAAVTQELTRLKAIVEEKNRERPNGTQTALGQAPKL